MTEERKTGIDKSRRSDSCGTGPDFDALSWMSKHSEEMSGYSGKWIALKLPQGIVASGNELSQVVRDWQKMYPEETPFVFKVPHDDEGAFVP